MHIGSSTSVSPTFDHSLNPQKREINTKNPQLLNIQKQIENVEKSISQLKQKENISPKEKAEKLKELQKNLQELQKQLQDVQKQEKEKEVEKKKHQKEEKKIDTLSEEEKEKKLETAKQKMLASTAIATTYVKNANTMYAKVKEYTTKGKLGMGSKYKGNASLAEVQGYFSKASKYGKQMMKYLNTATGQLTDARKVVDAYKKHQKPKEKEDENAQEI